MSDGTLSIRKKDKIRTKKSSTPTLPSSDLSLLDDDETEPTSTSTSTKQSASFSILDFAKTFLGAEVPEKEPGVTKPAPIRTGTARFFQRGSAYDGAEDDYRIESVRKQKLKAYDQQLKKFQYHAALDHALMTHSPVTIASVLDELIDRSALNIALSGRDDISLEPFLRFCIKYIGHPYYSTLICDCTNMVLDMYGSVLGSSPLIDELIHLLSTAITRETSTHTKLLHLQGSVDTLIHASYGIVEEKVNEIEVDEEEDVTAEELIASIQQKKRKNVDEDDVAAAATSPALKSTSPALKSTSPTIAPATSTSTSLSTKKSKKLKT